MTDLNQTIMQQASGQRRLDPDQQKRFLESFQERVLVTASLEEANSPITTKILASVLQSCLDKTQPIYVKISPQVQSSYQLDYLKISQERNIPATIVSAECNRSPYGLVIHTDHPVDEELLPLSSFLEEKEEKQRNNEKKLSFWSRLFKNK